MTTSVAAWGHFRGLPTLDQFVCRAQGRLSVRRRRLGERARDYHAAGLPPWPEFTCHRVRVAAKSGDASEQSDDRSQSHGQECDEDDPADTQDGAWSHHVKHPVVAFAVGEQGDGIKGQQEGTGRRECHWQRIQGWILTRGYGQESQGGNQHGVDDRSDGQC